MPMFTNCHSYHFLSMIFGANFWHHLNFCASIYFQVHCWHFSMECNFGATMQEKYFCHFNNNFLLFKSLLSANNEISVKNDSKEKQKVIQ